MRWAAGGGGEPRTNVGLWLRALLRGDKEDYGRLVHTLNRGQKGWNDDEPAVAEATCEIMTRQYFSARPDVPVFAFVADMRRRIAIEKTPPRQEDMEAVIRAALDGTATVPSSIKRSELLNIRVAVTGNIADILKLDAKATDRLIRQAERTAEQRGFRPPLAAEARASKP